MNEENLINEEWEKESSMKNICIIKLGEVRGCIDILNKHKPYSHSLEPMKRQLRIAEIVAENKHKCKIIEVNRNYRYEIKKIRLINRIINRIRSKFISTKNIKQNDICSIKVMQGKHKGYVLDLPYVMLQNE